MLESSTVGHKNQVEVIPPTELMARIRAVGTLANPEIRPYENSEISIVSMAPKSLNPMVLYVLKDGMETQRKVIEFLLSNGVDPFKLDSMIKYTFEGEDHLMVPPIVEVHKEKDGVTYIIIIDGLHRLKIAMEMEKDCNVVYIKGASLPPHAMPVGWDKVNPYDKVPKEKKIWRDLSTVELPKGMDLDGSIDPRYILYRDLSSLGSHGVRKS